MPDRSDLVVEVPAKVNLALCVGPRRADGYHELATLFQAVSLYDEVALSARDDGQIRLAMTGEGSETLACDQTNLAMRAALLMRERAEAPPGLGADIRIDKHVPMAGGMAGGSADAAAVLVGCNALWGLGLSPDQLAALGAELGSDVSFLVYGGNALGTGRGEKLAPQPAGGPLEWVFATAPRGLSTPLVYRTFDDMAAQGRIRPNVELPDEALRDLCSGEAQRVAPWLRNDLQAAALELYPELAATLEAGRPAGALAAIVSGSGPTCAFLATDAAAADRLAEQLPGLSSEVRDVRRAHGPVPGPQARVDGRL